MKPKKKNNLFTFICSFFPGAAEMYMGFMKLGLSLMGTFAFACALTAVGIAESFFFLVIVIWAYGFFHARNLASTSEEDFRTLQDHLIFEEFGEFSFRKPEGKKCRKWAAVSMIFIGLSILWKNFSGFLYRLIPRSQWNTLSPLVDRFPETVLSILIILIGIRLIRGKKAELEPEKKGKELPDSYENT